MNLFPVCVLRWDLPSVLGLSRFAVQSFVLCEFLLLFVLWVSTRHLFASMESNAVAVTCWCVTSCSVGSVVTSPSVLPSRLRLGTILIPTTSLSATRLSLTRLEDGNIVNIAENETGARKPFYPLVPIKCNQNIRCDFYRVSASTSISYSRAKPLWSNIETTSRRNWRWRKCACVRLA